ncbi:hypothetical protein [Rhodococcus tibetensis]|uniref:Integral membrane protein n=1 Tax=Rhodococcus tibetensis TaxID=2965064 RepID=A0ABT1QB41_9NOCA|nr:hypothetical protein [Rhodococcus sp. FXJ9.536]MCQ4118935.1 hypothetical protein [Rhodococcus sp. FXJ9.536]
MDAKNYFDTRTTYNLVRIEYTAAFAVCVALAVAHIDRIDWIPALLLFFYIDVIGYVPGAIYCRLRRTNHPPRSFYVLYNVMHSAITQGAVVGAWIAAFGAQWALLAIPIHVFADRGLFGNQMKVFSTPFEPTRIQPFTDLLIAMKEQQQKEARLTQAWR